MREERQPVLMFAHDLLTTGDLDPIYVMLSRSELDRDQLRRWCLGYWMFYHAGVASALSEARDGQAFWATVQRAQDLKWPRGTERRHFKGAQSQRAIDELRVRHPDPSEAVQFVEGEPGAHFTLVMARAQVWRGFGPWIAFKMADMVDAVLGGQVDFTGAVPHFFDDPLKGGTLVYHQVHTRHPDPVAAMKAPTLRVDQITYTHAAVEYLRERLGDYPAPHAPERKIALQEYETILCKYKSHMNGHYPTGKDTREIRHVLAGGWGKTAEHLMDLLPTVE